MRVTFHHQEHVELLLSLMREAYHTGARLGSRNQAWELEEARKKVDTCW